MFIKPQSFIAFKKHAREKMSIITTSTLLLRYSITFNNNLDVIKHLYNNCIEGDLHAEEYMYFIYNMYTTRIDIRLFTLL